MLVHAFNPSIQEAEAGPSLLVGDQPVYTVRSRTDSNESLSGKRERKERKLCLSGVTELCMF